MNLTELQEVIAIVCAVGGLPGGLAPDEDFYAAGFSSIRALQLLMELESRYDVSIPDDDFIAARCASDLQTLLNRLLETGK
jgi:acyl carrier protein